MFVVEEDDAGARLDAFAAAMTGLSRASVQRLLERGDITRNGTPTAKSTRLLAGDLVAVSLFSPEPSSVEPEDIPLEIVYEDDDLAIVNKPKGMVVHPAPGSPRGTMVNALLYHMGGRLSGVGGVVRPGIVHRLDKDTSGLLAVAKNDHTHIALQEMIARHDFTRVYHAVLVGAPRESSGRVDAPIGRHPTNRVKMAVREEGRRAITDYRVLRSFAGFSYVELRLFTGRTHQIRVHMASLGHPVAGDLLYGGGRTPFERAHEDLFAGQCLHAKILGFTHPRDGRQMLFESPLPEYFTKILALLEGK